MITIIHVLTVTALTTAMTVLSVNVSDNRDRREPLPLQSGDNASQLLENPENPQPVRTWETIQFTENPQKAGENR